MTNQRYHLANIRELLTRGFDDVELRALCFDVPDFRPVYERLARGLGKTEIVAELLEHAERNLQLDELLALAKELNPARYEQHGPYIVGERLHLDVDTSQVAEGPLALAKTTSDEPQATFQVRVSGEGKVDKIVNIGQAGDVTIE